MPKTILTYTVLLAALLGMSSPAYADIEALQGAVLGPIQTVMQEVKSVQEQLTELQSELRSAVEGVSGAVKDVQSKVAEVQGMVAEAKGAIADPQGALSSMGSKMPGFLAELDVNDQEVLQGAIKENYFGQFSKSNLSAIKDNVKNSTSALKSTVKNSVEQVSDVSKTVSAASANLTASAANVVPIKTSGSSQNVQSVSGGNISSSVATENLSVSGLNSMKQISSASVRTISAAPIQTQVSAPISREVINETSPMIVQSSPMTAPMMAPMTATGKTITRQAFGQAQAVKAEVTPAKAGLSGLRNGVEQRPQSALQAVEGVGASAKGIAAEGMAAPRADLESLKADKLKSKAEADLAKDEAKAKAQLAKESAKSTKEAAKAEVKAQAVKADAIPAGAGLSSLKDSIAQSQAAVSATQEKLTNSAEKSSALKDKISGIKESVSQGAQESQARTSALSAIKDKAQSLSTEIKSNAVKANSGFRQKAIINKDIQPLDKGAWLDKAESIKVSVYKASETLAFGDEDTDMSKIAQEQAEKMMAIQRESFASLYAQAFTIRTNLKKKEKEKSIDYEDTRALIQAAKAQALLMSQRLRRILLMEAGLFNFKMSQAARQFNVHGNEEGEEKGNE